MARQIHISVIRRRKIRKQKRPKLETRFPINIFAHTTQISTQAYIAYNKRATTATNNMPTAAGVATDAGLPIITAPLPLPEQVDRNTGSPAASLVQPTICTRPLLYAQACDNNTTDRRKAQTPSAFETGKNKATTNKNKNNKNATQQKMIKKEE